MENFNLRNLKNKIVHFIGIGGISMSALAFILKDNGVSVQGSDESRNHEVVKLQKKGVQVFPFHHKRNVQNADVVVYSSAISDDNPELVFARKNNLLIMKRAELLGVVAGLYKSVISVAGSHGKTTTTAMISEVFIKAGLKPTIHVGGELNLIKSNYKLGNKKYFITESCEYKDNYLFIKPDISVILNIDEDHLDYFKNLAGVKASFLKFAKNTKKGGVVIACKDDLNSGDISELEESITFGTDKKADIRAVCIKEYKPCYFSFDVVFAKYKLGTIKLNIAGKHNVYNALAAILVGIGCGVDFCDIKSAVENFSGVKRRCEFISNKSGFSVYHDYAHHPKQIQSMIGAAKNLVGNKEGKIITIFEPHTYSRTKFLIGEFSASFKDSDMVIFAPVYSAREHPTEGYDSLKLFNETKKHNNNVEYLESYDEIYKRIFEVAKKGDVVMILGAGSIEKLAEKFK